MIPGQTRFAADEETDGSSASDLSFNENPGDAKAASPGNFIGGRFGFAGNFLHRRNTFVMYIFLDKRNKLCHNEKGRNTQELPR